MTDTNLLEITARLVNAAARRIRDRDKEIEVLTQERDNALLRIEQLETERNHPYGVVNPNA